MKKIFLFIVFSVIVFYANAQNTETDTLHLFLPHVTTIQETDTIYVHVRETIYVNCAEANGDGTLNGLFSVSETTKVRFSQGNLQFNATQGEHITADGNTHTGTWRFAANQYDIIGSNNKKISSSYEGWIDLFMWATSGYDNTTNDPYAVNYQPWSTSSSIVNNSYNYAGYGPSTNMLDNSLIGTSANYDWGVYNSITNGGNQAGMWRTLTKDEWVYLFYGRTNAEKLFGLGRVNGINGTILLPDDWITPDDLTFLPSTERDLEVNQYNKYSNTSSSGENYSNNTYSASEWQKMEAAGAVFLPAAGRRYLYNNQSVVNDIIYSGMYWASTRVDKWQAYILYFYSSYLSANTSGECHVGCSVRLVR